MQKKHLEVSGLILVSSQKTDAAIPLGRTQSYPSIPRLEALRWDVEILEC